EENTQGSLTVAVNAGEESDPPVYRTFTPYGAVAAGSGAWPDDRGFLDDPVHSSTGLVDVGARKYDPVTGLFISVDPVLDMSDPQTLNGYVYCGGDPVNGTDPTGELMDVGGVSGSASYIEGALARRQRAERRQYDQLASAVSRSSPARTIRSASASTARSASAADPIGWWVNVPASAHAGSYTSTITLNVVSGP
ncbi:MAG: RHS repeat-associated core domain-containing protein, partial [Trebonia sp.]